MKEFYIYTLKQSYIDKYGKIEPELFNSKGTVRPFICVKDTGGHNWLIPVTSLDPNKPNYEHKSKIIAIQSKSEANLDVKVLARLPDILGKSKSGFESVLTYYKTIPVKHKNIQPYFNTKGQHAKAQLDAKTLKVIKTNFNKYMANYFKGKPSGFLIGYCAGKNPEQVKKILSNYYYKSKEIRRELYNIHLARIKKKKEKDIRKQLSAADTERRRKLKTDYKQNDNAPNGTAAAIHDGIRGSPFVVVTDNAGHSIRVSKKNYDLVKEREQVKILTKEKENLPSKVAKNEPSPTKKTPKKKNDNLK